MSQQEFEAFKRYDEARKNCLEEDPEWDEQYSRLTPQQKGAMHRKWKQKADDEYYAEMRSGTPEGGCW